MYCQILLIHPIIYITAVSGGNSGNRFAKIIQRPLQERHRLQQPFLLQDPLPS
jgi:hypothetical protein